MNDELKKPLDEIKDEDILLKMIMHIYNLSEEANKSAIERWREDTLYARGEQMQRIDNPIPNARAKKKKTLHRDIIKAKIDNLSSLLSRGIPTVTIEAINSNQKALIDYSTDENGMISLVTAPYKSNVPAQALQQILQHEWRLRKERVLQKKIIDEVLTAGVAFRSFSLKKDAYRGNKIYPQLLQRDQILLDPQTTKLETFEDCRWIILKSEMTAADIERRWGIKETDYAGGNTDKSYSEQSGAVRMYTKTNPDGTQKKEVEMSTYPVFVLFWQPGQPDIIRFENGDKRERDLRCRKYIVVNKSKIVVNDFAEDLMGMYPVVAYCHDPIQHTWGGHSVVHGMKGTQDFINILMNYLAKNAQLRGTYNFLFEPGAWKQKNVIMGNGAIGIPVENNVLQQGKIKELPPGDVGASLIGLMQDLIAHSRELGEDPSGTLAGGAPTSVKSGRHANTILESANTLISQRLSMLDAGHEQAALIESLMIQQLIDLKSPYYQVRHNTGQIPDIDKAIKMLQFTIEIISKSNLPSTSLSAELTYNTSLFNMGVINLYDFMQKTGLLDGVTEDWMQKVIEYSKQQQPGIPPQLLAQVELQRQQQIDQTRQQIDENEQQMPSMSPILGEG